MTVLITYLFIPLLAKGPVAYAMAKLGGYNNYQPREQQSKLTGFGARELAVHQSAFESVIIFAPAALLALITNNTGTTITTLAVIHVIARVLYNIFYLFKISLLSSIVWAIATLCSFSIVFICIP